MLLKAALWYVLLLALAPAVVAYWGFLAFPAGDIFRAEGPWELGYSILCIVLLLLFLWRGVRRRLVLAAYIITLLALNIYYGVPSLDRIISFVAYCALFGIAFEFYRQNRPLYNELKASGVGLWRIVLRAMLLWSPMLIFVLVGLSLNYLIVESTKNALYATALIDQYCVIRDDPEKPVIPCTNLGKRLRVDQLQPLTLDQDIRIQVEHTFLFWKKKTLERLANIDPAKLDHEKAMTEINLFVTELQPVNMFGLEAPDAPRMPDYGNDPRVVSLNKKLAVVQKRIDNCKKILFVFANRKCERLRAEKSGLLKQRKARMLTLDKDQQKRLKKERADDPEKAYRSVLYKYLNLKRITSIQDLHVGLRGDVKEKLKRKDVSREEILASMKVAVVNYMSRTEARSARVMTALLKRNDKLAYELGVVRHLCRLNTNGGEVGDGSEFDCPSAARVEWALDPLPFRESIDRSVTRWHARSERNLERQLARTKLASSSSARELIRTNNELWEAGVVPQNIGLEQKRCGLDPKCHVFNWAKEGAEDAYDDARGKLKDEATQAVGTAANGSASSLNRQVDLARTVLHDALGELRRQIDETIEGIARGGAIVSAFLQLWLFLVVIKSVLYVLATEVFNVKSVPVIGLESRGDVEGTYTRSTNIEIPASFTTPMQTSTVGINQGKRTVIPQPFRGMLSRIIHGKWMLNRGTHAENATMRFTQPGGRVGIDWQMAEGEEIVFRYRDLLGFSENVELRTTISLRLSTLLFGRYIYHSARCVSGPGRLLLSVKGDVEPEQHKVETFPLERLIAWNMHTRFRVTDERTISAVFKDGFTIRRVRQGSANGGLVLVGAPVSEEPRFEGTMRFVKTFLMPI